MKKSCRHGVNFGFGANSHMISHKIMTSFGTLNKFTSISLSTEFLRMKNLGILHYITNSVNIITLNSIIQSV